MFFACCRPFSLSEALCRSLIRINTAASYFKSGLGCRSTLGCGWVIWLSGGDVRNVPRWRSVTSANSIARLLIMRKISGLLHQRVAEQYHVWYLAISRVLPHSQCFPCYQVTGAFFPVLTISRLLTDILICFSLLQSSLWKSSIWSPALSCYLLRLTKEGRHILTLSLEHFTSCFLFFFPQPKTLFTDCSWTSGCVHVHSQRTFITGPWTSDFTICCNFYPSVWVIYQ